jgi:hypothetical protein
VIKRHWKSCIAVLGGLAVLTFALCLATHHRGIRYAGFGKIPAMSFAELQRSPPFVAVIESKMHGVWEAPVDSSTGKRAPGATPTEYVMVYLRNEHRKRLGICQENPTPEEVAFVSHLRDGERYSFPDVLIKWMKDSELTNGVPHKR